MSPLLWGVLGLGAVGLAVWAYAAREERVPGRAGPAALRAAAVFLVLGGLALPSLRGGRAAAPGRVALLDVSRSMTLPVRPGDPSTHTRFDSARAELAALDPQRVYLFGEQVLPVRPDSLGDLVPQHDRSRLGPALEAARLGGADSVWVITDGDIADRLESERLARDLGLGVREIRVALPGARVGLAGAEAPERARAGDTVRVIAEVVTGGAAEGWPDSLTIELRLDDSVVADARLATPAPGRAGRTALTYVPAGDDEEPVWRRHELAIAGGADPASASDRLPFWMEISESAGGAVVISSVPDWEARFLVQALSRLVLGGARGYLRLTEGRWLEMGPNPRMVGESNVRRAIRGSRLLVVQAAPADIPTWLAGELRGHARVLFLALGEGQAPGTGMRLSGPVPGEWYAMPPVPPSPASALLAEPDLEALPPVRQLYAIDPPGRWTVLSVYRGRRGEGRPLLVADERGDRRWAVSGASEWWRWALRAGSPRRVYEATLSGLIGWLAEDASPQLASLAEPPVAGRPLSWRIRPGATELRVEVVDENGAEVWSRSWEAPEARVMGPALDLGRYETRLTATGPDGPFASSRPIEIGPDPREMLPGAAGAPLRIPAVIAGRPSLDGRSPRPVWPFALAIGLLCCEWAWRHRIGLR